MRRLILTLATLAVPALGLTAPPVAIIGGQVVVGDGTVLDGATVIIEGERIAAVGASVSVPRDARVIDAAGKVVWPGMIDPYTSLGLVEVSADGATNDANETTSTSTAQLRASDGINPEAAPVAVTRIGGITTALVSPGSRNPINGQAAIIDLSGRTVPAMMVVDPAGIVLNFSVRRSDKYPSTTPGTVALIRQSFYDAQAYGSKKAAKGDEDDEENEKPGHGGKKTDLEKEALLALLDGRIPAIAVAPRATDILNALQVAQEFSLRLILAGAREAWKVTDEIKAAGVPVLLGDTFATPGERDPYDRYYSLAATLFEAGIELAFTTEGNHNVRQLPEHAAMAVTFGFPEEEAAKALTSWPARILGIIDSHGSLEAGKIANVVVWSGNPLQITSRAQHVFIRGEEVPLVSRQERLRDRYSEPANRR